MKELKAVERIAKLNADNFALLSKVRTKDIIAIAGAFRALEQRAEEEKRRADQNAEYLEALTERMLEAEAALERESDIHIDTAASMREWRLRAEAAEAKLAQREKLDEEAMHCATILEFIGNFESDDIDGDEVDLRFEIDGEDTGCDVSITEYALRSAKAIRSILSGASISRPAPAADLAELVPQPFDVFKQAGGVMVAVREGKTKNHLFGKGYNACIAYVINSIINSGELTRPDCESDEARLCEILRNIEEAK